VTHICSFFLLYTYVFRYDRTTNFFFRSACLQLKTAEVNRRISYVYVQRRPRSIDTTVRNIITVAP